MSAVRRVRRPAAHRRRTHRRGLPGRARSPGWCRSGPRGATPYGGFPWARLAFSQADSPLAHVARWLGAPGVTFAVAVVGTLLLVAVDLGAPPVLGACRGWPPSLAVGARGRRAAGHRAAHRRARRCRSASCRATCRRPGWSSTPSVGPCSTTTSTAPSGSPRRAPGRPQPRRLAGELLRHRPVPQPRRRRADRQRPPRRGGARCSSAPCSPSRRTTARTSRCSTCPGVAEPQRYVKLHPVPFAEYIPSRAFFRMFTPMADLAGNFVAGHEIGIFRVPAAARRLRRPCRRSASRWPTTT